MSKTKTLPARFYVRTPTEELWNLVQNRLFELGFFWWGGKKITQFSLYREESCVSFNHKNNNMLEYSPFEFYQREKGMEEVQIADLFLAELPKKEITIDILPWKVVIKGDKVDIGCQKDRDLQTFKDAIFNDFSSNRGEKVFYGQTVSFSRQGFYVGVDFVSWETFDKFVAELKKVK